MSRRVGINDAYFSVEGSALLQSVDVDRFRYRNSEDREDEGEKRE